MNQYIRDKSEEHEVEGAKKAKIRYPELETKQHEDRLRHIEVTNVLVILRIFSLFVF
jgi:hypothetical protein